MSSLWRRRTQKNGKTKNSITFNRKEQKNKIKKERPFPKQTYKFKNLIQSLNSHTPFLPMRVSIKGISPFMSLERKMEASMTVEAAVILPLFLLFFLNLSCALEILRLHSNLQLALRDAGNRLSVYGYVLEEMTPQENAAGVALAYGYIRDELVRYVGKDYLDASPLKNGASELQFWESTAFGAGDRFELNVTYSVSPWADAVGFYSFRMANRYYGHFWTGYEIPGSSGENMPEATVYVAENGSVYHEARECSYLNITINKIIFQEIESCRNENGRKYSRCEKCCMEDRKGTVFITPYGDRYHYSETCPGLKRTVYSLLRIEAEEEFAPCSRCCGSL